MPSIYVASLADYTNGHLHGVWIDLDVHCDIDDVHNIVQKMLDNSLAVAYGHVEVAEEYAIHDFDGFEGFDVHESLPVADAVVIGEAIEEYGSSFAWFLNGRHGRETVAESVENFQDRHVGTWNSLEDYAWEQFEELFPDSYHLATACDWVSFEPEIWVRTEECDGYEFIETVDGVTVLAPDH